MEVNFKLKVRPSLYSEELVEHDFTKEIANSIWQSAKNVAEADFALRLFKSENNIEISNEEKLLIKSSINQFVWWAKSEILKVLGD